jgi:tetratricopeptide (TPR) repeat protein
MSEPQQTAESLSQRARQAAKEGRLGDAEGSWLAAIALLRQDGSKAQLGRALRELGELERKIQNPAAARQHYEEAVSLLREAGETLVLAHTIRHLGDVHRDAGRLTEAEPCYVEALTIYRRQTNAPPLDLANAIRSFAVLRGDTGENKAAAELWREARGLYQFVGVQEGVAESDRQITRLTSA